MNIVIAVERFVGDQHGGGYRIAWDSAKALQQRGHRVTLIAESLSRELSSEVVDRVEVLRYPSQAHVRNRLRARRAALAQALREHFSSIPPDLIIGHMPIQFWGATDAFPQCETAYVAHSSYADEVWVGTDRKTPLLFAKAIVAGLIERKVFRRADRIVAFSNFTRQLIRKRHRSRFGYKIKVTPAWTDSTAFTLPSDKSAVKLAVGWSADVPVLFTLRRLVPRMGLDRLIAAAIQLRNEGFEFQLRIAGDGPLRGALQEQVERANASPYIHLMGGPTESDLRAYYAAADVFVIPTKALECFGLIAVEAMSAGIPVLSTPVGALPEVVGGIEPRWLARDNSVAAIAELVRSYLQGALPTHDPQQLRAFATENYGATALQRFCDLVLA
jgi:glycosyltransferase involved in cell wall biosynthesis